MSSSEQNNHFIEKLTKQYVRVASLAYFTASVANLRAQEPGAAGAREPGILEPRNPESLPPRSLSQRSSRVQRQIAVVVVVVVATSFSLIDYSSQLYRLIAYS